MLGVSVETLRRWIAEGKVQAHRSEGRQRLVPLQEVSRLLRERRGRAGDARGARTGDRAADRGTGGASSARNRFVGVVTRVERDAIAAVVEVQAGPHRLVSLMTAEAVDELGLVVGDEAACVVKATNVIVERQPRRDRG